MRLYIGPHKMGVGMDADFTVLGSSALAVYLTIFLKNMGFDVCLVLNGRRLGDIPLQPMREDHLELAGVEPGKYSEAIHTECLLGRSEEVVRLENPIHICRMTEVLEQAAAHHLLKLSINVNTDGTAKIIDCRRPIGRPHNVFISAGIADNRKGFTIETHTQSLKIYFDFGPSSELLFTYGRPPANASKILMTYSYSLTPPSQLSSASLSNPWKAKGLAPASPLGDAVAEILLAQHLAATADRDEGLPEYIKLITESQRTVASIIAGEHPEPKCFRSLIYSIDKY
ncbi:hypothetical protein HRbin01_01176 [archaeon HR01]|nr:hypothetical protein HRbin01_01176 [archaeon HR01]